MNMAYLPDEIPGPEPTVADQQFWDYCQQRKLRFQRCSACQCFRHPPTPACPYCHAFESEWLQAPETGVIFSFTIVHHAAHPAMKEIVPYNVAIVDFPECDHARLVSNVIDVAPTDIRIGMAVTLAWETAGNGMIVPRFKRKI
jgi:uncharacterized OB-fold protein